MHVKKEKIQSWNELKIVGSSTVCIVIVLFFCYTLLSVLLFSSHSGGRITKKNFFAVYRVLCQVTHVFLKIYLSVLCVLFMYHVFLIIHFY